LTTGEFEKVGGSSQEAQTHAKTHGDLVRRRALLENIKRLNQELMQLDKSDAPSRN
jgi:hypothetical protein